MLLMVVGVSFTSCSKKLTQQEVQQINSASAETKAEYEQLKAVKEDKSDAETKLAKEEKKKGKQEYEKRKMRKKLGYEPEEEPTDSTKTEAAPAE